MPAGQTLDELVTALRAEIGDSTNSSMGIDGLPGLRQTLKRVQETYYADFDWPQLEVNRDEPVEAGERFYTFNEDVNFERIFKAWIQDGNEWEELAYGITPDHYNSSNPETGETGCPSRWSHYEENQFELWPVPDTASKVRFRCIRNLKPFTAPTDVCTLDGTLIVLMAAAELLARQKSEDAPLKLQIATSHYNRLKANAQKNRMFVLGGGQTPPAYQPPVIRAPR